jgi:hypothetical protein
MGQNHRVFWSTWLLAALAAGQPEGQPDLLSDTPVQFRRLESRRDCQVTIPKLRRLCQPKWFSKGAGIEVALEDFDNDGLEDVAVRFRSRPECISHGCPTHLYHARRGTFVVMDHKPLSDGPVSRCRTGSKPGVAITESGHNRVCLMFPGWTEKDMDPPVVVRFQGARFTKLTGSKLRAALIGHSLQATPCSNTGQCLEWFFEHGRYDASEDRGINRGVYVLRSDRYCAGWDDYRFCAAVYRSADGRLATTNLKCGAPCLSLVERQPVSRSAD